MSGFGFELQSSQMLARTRLCPSSAMCTGHPADVLPEDSPSTEDNRQVRRECRAVSLSPLCPSAVTYVLCVLACTLQVTHSAVALETSETVQVKRRPCGASSGQVGMLAQVQDLSEFARVADYGKRGDSFVF